MKQWSHQVQSAVFKALSSNAPLELEYCVILIPGKSLQIVPGNDAKNVSTPRVTPRLQMRVSLVT
jgi:hypothetical protein